MSTTSWKKHKKKCKEVHSMWENCILHKKNKDRSCTNSHACRTYFKLWLQCTNKYLEYGYREDPRDFWYSSLKINNKGHLQSRNSLSNFWILPLHVGTIIPRTYFLGATSIGGALHPSLLFCMWNNKAFYFPNNIYFLLRQTRKMPRRVQTPPTRPQTPRQNIQNLSDQNKKGTKKKVN